MMHSLFTLLLAGATAISAHPTETTTTTTTPKTIKFTAFSFRSGSTIQQMSINANSGQFWIARNTSTFCPSTSPYCAHSTKDKTIFTLPAGAKTSTPGLDVVVPGGQYVYVAAGDAKVNQAAGQLRFTEPHSSFTSGPAITKGFAETKPQQITFEGKDWLACPVLNETTKYYEYTIYAASRATAKFGKGCQGFALRYAKLPQDTPAAFQYD